MKIRDRQVERIADYMETLKRRVKRHRDGAITIWPGVLDSKRGMVLEYGKKVVGR